MSLGSFLKSIWKAIEKVFGRLGKEGRRVIIDAHDIVERMKGYIDDPRLDVLTVIIPGPADDAALQAAREIARRLLLAIAALMPDLQEESEERQMRAVVSRVNNSDSKKLKKVVYHGLASSFAEDLSNGDIPWSESTATMEYYRKFESGA